MSGTGVPSSYVKFTVHWHPTRFDVSMPPSALITCAGRSEFLPTVLIQNRSRLVDGWPSSRVHNRLMLPPFHECSEMIALIEWVCPLPSVHSPTFGRVALAPIFNGNMAVAPSPESGIGAFNHAPFSNFTSENLTLVVSRMKSRYWPGTSVSSRSWTGTLEVLSAMDFTVPSEDALICDVSVLSPPFAS